MSWQLSCSAMCKFMVWLGHNVPYKNGIFYISYFVFQDRDYEPIDLCEAGTWVQFWIILMNLGNLKTRYLNFLYVSWYCDGRGCLKPALWKTRTNLLCKVHTIGANDMSRQFLAVMLIVCLLEYFWNTKFCRLSKYLLSTSTRKTVVSPVHQQWWYCSLAQS